MNQQLLQYAGLCSLVCFFLGLQDGENVIDLLHGPRSIIGQGWMKLDTAIQQRGELC